MTDQVRAASRAVSAPQRADATDVRAGAAGIRARRAADCANHHERAIRRFCEFLLCSFHFPTGFLRG